MPRSARLNVAGVEPKGSKCNLKNFECLSDVVAYYRHRRDWTQIRPFKFSQKVDAYRSLSVRSDKWTTLNNQRSGQTSLLAADVNYGTILKIVPPRISRQHIKLNKCEKRAFLQTKCRYFLRKESSSTKLHGLQQLHCLDLQLPPPSLPPSLPPSQLPPRKLAAASGHKMQLLLVFQHAIQSYICIPRNCPSWRVVPWGIKFDLKFIQLVSFACASLKALTDSICATPNSWIFLFF